MEAGVLLDLQGAATYWHLPPGRTAGGLPDSQELWDVLWANRENVSGFAHSHPGSGTPGPSYTDVTTFAAVEAGLGRRLDWWITTSDSVAMFRWIGPHRLDYAPVGVDGADAAWVPELRRVSGQI